MKRIIIGIMALCTSMCMQAQENKLYILISETANLNKIPVTLYMNNNVAVEGIQASFALPNGLTKDNFVYNSTEEAYVVLDAARCASVFSRNQFEYFTDVNPNDLLMGFTSGISGRTIAAGSGAIGTFYFNGSSLKDGTYSVKMYAATIFPDANTRYDQEDVELIFSIRDGKVIDDSTPYCIAPQISRSGSTNSIVISTGTDGATIYYTLDGSNPTTLSALYQGPVAVTHNCTVTAFAVKDEYHPSSVSVFNVDWFKVETPTFEYKDLKLAISTTTEGANIYYTTNGNNPEPNTDGTQLYTEPLSLTENATVKAIAVKEDFNDSEVSTYSFNVAQHTCATPVIKRDGTQDRVMISCATENAVIHYTTDGSTPTASNAVYDGSIAVTHNCTIKAFAVMNGMFPSTVGVFNVDWFKVETPTFEYKDFYLSISTTTEGASIYYTTDGTDPKNDLSNAQLYKSPILMEANMIVKAIAVKQNFTHSDISSYTFVASENTCEDPQISRDGQTNRIVMSCSTDGATIYYTTDGSRPTKESAVYNGPVTMTHNCKVLAYAVRDDLFPSSLCSFSVDWFNVSPVTTEYQNGVLALNCATANAKIYYEIGGAEVTEQSPLYTQLITLTDNRIVKYMAYASGFNPTGGSFTPTDFTCAPVTIKYDGLHVTLVTTEENATIYYTMDGSTPTKESDVFSNKVLLSGLCTVKAKAVKEYKNDSQVMVAPITYFFDGTTITTSEAGHLQQATEWKGTTGLTELFIDGKVNSDDMMFLRTISDLKHLNLENTQFEAGKVPEGAFEGMNIVSVVFPKNIAPLGNVFSGCNHLSAIIWNTYDKMASSAESAGITNPNLLLYVVSQFYAPEGIRNVVVGDNATSIVLSDDDNGSFYCPKAFTAQRISYTHRYTQTTGVGECRGWETIALPFDVQTITHETKGGLLPFFVSDASTRSFWLCGLDENGFVGTEAIKANTPYIIAMPNNEMYPNSYCLAGLVTFSATNIVVPITSSITSSKGSKVLNPCFDTIEQSSNIFTINKNQSVGKDPEGSIFVPDYRAVKPFEAYLTLEGGAASMRVIPIFEDDETGIMELQSVGIMELQNGTYDLTGRKVQGELKRGVYIVNGKKVMVK